MTADWKLLLSYPRNEYLLYFSHFIVFRRVQKDFFIWCRQQIYRKNKWVCFTPGVQYIQLISGITVLCSLLHCTRNFSISLRNSQFSLSSKFIHKFIMNRTLHACVAVQDPILVPLLGMKYENVVNIFFMVLQYFLFFFNSTRQN